MEHTLSAELPQVRQYTKALAAHYDKAVLNTDEWLDAQLANPPLVTPDVLEFLRALIVLGERESVEPSGYTTDKLLELAEANGHKRGYLYSLTYLVSVLETVEERKNV